LNDAVVATGEIAPVTLLVTLCERRERTFHWRRPRAPAAKSNSSVVQADPRRIARLEGGGRA